MLALAAGRLAKLRPTPRSTGGTFWGVPRGRHTVGAWQRFVKYPRHGRYHSLGDGGCRHQRGALLIVHVQAAFFGGSSVLCVASPPPKDPRICPGPSVWLRCAPLRACSLPRLGRGGHRGWTSDQSPLGFPNSPFNLLSWALEQSSPPP